MCGNMFRRFAGYEYTDKFCWINDSAINYYAMCVADVVDILLIHSRRPYVCTNEMFHLWLLVDCVCVCVMCVPSTRIEHQTIQIGLFDIRLLI